MTQSLSPAGLEHRLRCFFQLSGGRAVDGHVCTYRTSSPSQRRMRVSGTQAAKQCQTSKQRAEEQGNIFKETEQRADKLLYSVSSRKEHATKVAAFLKICLEHSIHMPISLKLPPQHHRRQTCQVWTDAEPCASDTPSAAPRVVSVLFSLLSSAVLIVFRCIWKRFVARDYVDNIAWRHTSAIIIKLASRPDETVKRSVKIPFLFSQLLVD